MTNRTLLLALTILVSPSLGLHAQPVVRSKAAARAAETVPVPSAGAPGSFDRTLSLQGVTFHVSSTHTEAADRVRIEPRGLEGSNVAVETPIDGTVTDAEVADLDRNGSPEIYVYVTSVGSGSYGSLVAYAVNKGKSMTEIHLPPLTDDAKAARGYMGHDEFRIVENTLVRRFPVYRDKDSNARPTGGTRQVQYHLKAGEAGWVLRPDRVVNY